MDQTHYGAGGTSLETFPGSVVTRRWFEINAFTLLESPFRRQWFETGNEVYHALCSESPISRFNSSGYRAWANEERWRKTHRVGQRSCSCGFYSYFGIPDPSDLEMDRPDAIKYIGAIVENTGRITYGSLGLRSEKMRIVALVVVTPKFNWTSFVQKFKGPQALLYVWASMMTWGIVLGIGGAFTGNSVTYVFGYAAGIVLTPLTMWGFTVLRVKLFAPKRLRLSTETLNTIKKRYPVPVYYSWKEAEKHHPHTRRSDLPSDKRGQS